MRNTVRPSEVNVQAQSGDDYGAAVTVVPGMSDVLEIQRGKYPTPNMQGVIRLCNGFAGIAQSSISQNETIATQGQIFLVVT